MVSRHFKIIFFPLIFFTASFIFSVMAQEINQLTEIAISPLGELDAPASGWQPDLQLFCSQVSKLTSISFDLTPDILHRAKPLKLKQRMSFFELLAAIAESTDSRPSYSGPYEVSFWNDFQISSVHATKDFLLCRTICPAGLADLSNLKRGETYYTVNLIADWRHSRILDGKMTIVQGGDHFILPVTSKSNQGTITFASTMKGFSPYLPHTMHLTLSLQEHCAQALVFQPKEESLYVGDVIALKTGKVTKEVSQMPVLPMMMTFRGLFSQEEWDALEDRSAGKLAVSKIKSLKSKIPSFMGFYYFPQGLPTNSVDSFSVSPPMHQPIIEIQLPIAKIGNPDVRIGGIFFSSRREPIKKEYVFQVKATKKTGPSEKSEKGDGGQKGKQ